MASEPRKISARALITDIRAGLSDPVLMQKHALSEKQLKAAFRLLIEKGALNQSDLDHRATEPLAGRELAEERSSSKVPAQKSPLSVAKEKVAPGLRRGAILPEKEEGPPGEREKKPASADAKVEELSGARNESGEGEPAGRFDSHVDRADAFAKRMLGILRNTDQPMLSYVWRAWLIAFIPSIVVSSMATAVFAVLGYEDRLPEMSPMFFLIVGVIIAPWVETVFMGWILGVLKLIIKNTIWVCVASAIIWGVLHGLQSIGQGLAVTWVFFVLSLSFMEWWKKSKSKAIRAAALIHTCQNALAFLALLTITLVGVEPTKVKKIPPSSPAQTKQVSSGREAQKPQSKEAISAPTPGQPTGNKQAPERNKQ